MLRPTREWALSMALGLALALGLGLLLVWINIERVDMAYGFKKLQTELEAREAHADKLQIERDNLVSPYRLRQKAQELGLGPARSGQIRRVHTAGANGEKT